MTEAGDEVIKTLLKRLDDVIGADAASCQSEILRNILRHNAGVSYLRRYLGSNSGSAPPDSDTFRRAVPLSRYEDYAEYINKMANGVINDEDDGDDGGNGGPRPFLSVDPLICFFYSSGTSSMKPKLIPYFDSKPAKEITSLAHQASWANLTRLFPPRPEMNKVLWFLYGGNVTKTKGGYKAMAASASRMHNNASGSGSKRLLEASISPKEVILGSDSRQQMYCHLLCGIRNYDLIDSIRAHYAAGLSRAFRLLESKWDQLCQDIELGSPAAEITDPAMRESVANVLSCPRPDLSAKFRAIFRENSWEGIVIKLWPNVHYIKTVTTGTMLQYYEHVRYYAGAVPILGGDYFSSECSIAVNSDIFQPPESTRYTLIPTAAYFEFLPFDMDRLCAIGSETVDISGVELGRFYEIVVTTYLGFYRYHLGDVVKVVGHYRSSPQVEYVMRAPKSPGEIITETDLVSAIKCFREIAQITDFTSSFDLEAQPNRLKIFLEFKDLRIEKCEMETKLRRCYRQLEDDLGGIYKVMKSRDEVCSLLLCVVKPGSFDSLLQLAVDKGASASQYKPPKILRDHRLVEFMEMSAILMMSADTEERFDVKWIQNEGV